MSKKSNSIIANYIILSLLVFLTACSPLVVVQPSSGAPSPANEQTQEMDATLTAFIQQTIQAQVPTQTVAAATFLPATATQGEVEHTPATSIPAVTECQDSAQYINDDGMDGTKYAPNTQFTKTWTLKNTGSCTWDSSYLVFQISGTYMTQQPGYWIVQNGQTVLPDQTINISIGMTSPVENGNYQSYWGLKNGNGKLIPIQGGANGNSFFVMINVSNGDIVTDGRITAASIDIEHEQGSGALCAADSTYFVHAHISSDGPATASYEIYSSAGQIAAGYFQDSNNGSLSPSVIGSVVFDKADTKTIDLRFVGPFPYPDDISILLRVNGGEFYSSKLSCKQASG